MNYQEKLFNLRMKISINVAVAFLSLFVVLLGVLISCKTRQVTKEATIPEVKELLSLQTSRVIETYNTEILHEVEINGHGTMPHSFFIHAYWDIVLINNGINDLTITKYSIEPLDKDIPSAGPYRASFAQGLFDFQTNMPVDLPVSISAGHFIHLKVRSFIVILTTETILNVAKHWKQGLPSGKISMWDLFYNYFAKYGVDFFGNNVSAGPTGITPNDNSKVKDQQLLFRIYTGRGNVSTGILKWY